MPDCGVDLHSGLWNSDDGRLRSEFQRTSTALELPKEARAALEAQTSRLAAISIPVELKDETKGLIKRAVEESFVAGFRVVILMAASLALLSALFAWLLIEGRSGTVAEAAGVPDLGRKKAA
jgi:hypothetical protein